MTVKAIQPRAQVGADGDQPSQQFRYGWINATEAMTYLDVHSLNALYRLIKEWELPYGRIGRLYRFRRADLDAWLVRRSADRRSA